MRSDYVYKDRKMMKWIPFHALLEQGEYINDLLKGREYKEMPVLSVDQLEDLNYKLETAYVFQNEIEITYYKDHDYHKLIGTITRTDLHNKLLFIGEKSINAQMIIHIEII